MRHWKRLVYYLMINILVSACTVLAVLAIWDRTRPPVLPGQESPAQATTTVTPSFFGTETGIGGSEIDTPATSQADEEPEPTEESDSEAPRGEIEYEVKAGDTLGGIAFEFGISLEELLEANPIADPDRLEVGQTLIIPASEEAVPTDIPEPEEETEPAEETKPAEETEIPTTPTPTQATVTGEAKAVIGSVVGAGVLDSERVLIKRTGAGELSMAGWQLVEEDGQEFTFPQLTLFEGGAVNLHTRSGQPTVVDLYWGLDKPVWKSGETVVLLDDQGEVRATYQVP